MKERWPRAEQNSIIEFPGKWIMSKNSRLLPLLQATPLSSTHVKLRKSFFDPVPRFGDDRATVTNSSSLGRTSLGTAPTTYYSPS